RLATHYRCIAPDLPGFGHSEVPADFERSLDGLTEFIQQFLNAARSAMPSHMIRCPDPWSISTGSPAPHSVTWISALPTRIVRVDECTASSFVIGTLPLVSAGLSFGVKAVQLDFELSPMERPEMARGRKSGVSRRLQRDFAGHANDISLVPP